MSGRWQPVWISVFWLCHTTVAHALSILTYNVAGNGATDWTTNSAQLQAIGRQVSYLNPDIVTFNEIPFDHTTQMTNFVRVWLPGYFLATNSGTDGFIRSVIASRYPITRSQRWLSRTNLSAFGYNGPFTRDLFEAEVQVPAFSEPVHVFTSHLKAGTDQEDLLRRRAEASAISNFFVNTFLPTRGTRPYVLTGDLNEDTARLPGSTNRAIERFVNSITDLQPTTPRNPFNDDDRTISSTSPFRRYDYILPCGLMFSNIASAQVFRSDLLNPRPPAVLSNDSQVASDHLPVLMVFYNPYDVPFSITSSSLSNGMTQLTWQSASGRVYQVEASTNFLTWSPASSSLTASVTTLSWTISNTAPREFYRIHRLP